MSNLTGSAPYQIPTNADLGTLAFRDADPYTDTASVRVTVPASTTTTLDSYSIWQFRTSKYVVQATYAGNIYASEILVTHDGTYVYYTEFGRLANQTNTPLAAFTATLSNDLINFQFNNTTGSAVTVTVTRLSINL
jgi:hypothetical protein